MEKISKADKLFIKSYLKQKYPSCTHKLNLDMTFDYYAGLCTQLLEKNKQLTHQLLGLDKDEILIIDNYIKDNNNENGRELLLFYIMTKAAIIILNKYYNEDGSIKID